MQLVAYNMFRTLSLKSVQVFRKNTTIFVINNNCSVFPFNFRTILPNNFSLSMLLCVTDADLIDSNIKS